MRIHRLRVTDLAAIREADIELGPGLNILYGPNDLGKSTLADAIRLALLLPHTSTHIEDYVPWSGGQNPTIELTFESEPQRIWRVTKEFRRGGSAVLEESKNGRDFDEVERARKVDGALRELLRWGIPEPGGMGGSKGLPSSFLATVLLTTQANVSAVLAESLEDDPTGTGKERIAAALQAVAQDPLFLALLRATQARLDQAYTEKGARKRAQGSVFKEAADRVNEAREEKERLQKIVEDSEDVEKTLNELAATRVRRETDAAVSAERVRTLQRAVEEARALAAAEEDVERARGEVERIRAMDAAIQTAAANVERLSRAFAEGEKAIAAAQRQLADARLSLAAAEHQRLVAAVDIARTAHDSAVAAERERRADLARLDLLEIGCEARAAGKLVATATLAVEQADAVRVRIEANTRERDTLSARRTALRTPPPTTSLTPLLRLETELESARRALKVGFVVTVVPRRPIELRVEKDGAPPTVTTGAETVEFEASAAVDLGIPDLAQVRIRGGLRETQETVRGLERRWDSEVVPLLATAGVADLDGLSARIEEAQALDTAIGGKDSELAALRTQLAAYADAAENLSASRMRLENARASLGVASLDSLASELDGLGREPLAELRTRKQRAGAALDSARRDVASSATALALSEDRCRAAGVSWETAAAARDAESDLEDDVEEARAAVARAEERVTQAETARTTAVKDHAAEGGRLDTLRTQRQAEDLRSAESRLLQASERRRLLPAPTEPATEADLLAARHTADAARADLDAVNGQMLKAQGRLEQVGGAVARDRLRDATEACDAAEWNERQIEDDYEAWKLLLEQMKEADAAQASNLGQVLAPAIAGRFEALTQKRYGDVRLTAQLETEGVFVNGAVRALDRLSVGTREQLSTLYRLSLAEHLRSALVLDDQLVQSDEIRMDWFRGLLHEKARAFQIIVFTCRPADYWPAMPALSEGEAAATPDGTIRAISLTGVVQRR